MTDGPIIVPVDDFGFSIRVTPPFTDKDPVIIDFVSDAGSWWTDGMAVDPKHVKALHKALKKAVKTPKQKRAEPAAAAEPWPADRVTRTLQAQPRIIPGAVYNDIHLYPDGVNLHVETVNPEGHTAGPATLDPEGAFQALVFLRTWLEDFVGLGAVYSRPPYGTLYHEQPDGEFHAVSALGNIRWPLPPLTRDEVISSGSRLVSIGDARITEKDDDSRATE